MRRDAEFSGYDASLGADMARPEQQQDARGTRYGRLLLLSTGDLDAAPPRGYLLKGILSPGEFSLWVGHPKCGKSFLMLHVAYRLALGLPVFGRRVHGCSVLYVAAEGQKAIEKRIQALRDRYGHTPDFHYVAQQTDLLHNDGHLQDLMDAATAIRAGLIVLDTINRVLAGGDENGSADMGTLVMNLTTLREETGAHVAGVHHGAKSDNGRGGINPRGHSSLTGADDVLVEVAKQEDGTLTARVVHAKDDADGMSFAFKLEQVELGEDEDGDAITTLIVDETDTPQTGMAQAASRGKRLPDKAQIALNCLTQALKANSLLAVVGDPAEERPVTSEAEWRQIFYRTGMPGQKADTKLKAFNRAMEKLLATGHVKTQDDYCWRPDSW